MSRRAVIVVLALVLLQAGAVLIYLRVQRGRSAPATPFGIERLSGQDVAPSLELDHHDGRTLDLPGVTGKLRLVHFWATWCPPCRKELPGLLEFGRELDRTQGVELLAISVDQDWTAISAFFPGGIPPEVLKSRDRRVHTRYGVMTLPDTYLISPAGKLVLRFGSARDWTTAAAREAVTREAKTWR